MKHYIGGFNDYLDSTEYTFIGGGAFGCVFKGKFDDSVKDVIIKINVEKDLPSKETFFREARIGKFVNKKHLKSGYKHWVQTLGFGSSTSFPERLLEATREKAVTGSKTAIDCLTNLEALDNTTEYLFIVQEVAGVQNLQEWILENYENQPIPERQLRLIMFQVIWALYTAHSKWGIQHNDLKIDNIMVKMSKKTKRKYQLEYSKTHGDTFEIQFEVNDPIIKIIDLGLSGIRVETKPSLSDEKFQNSTFQIFPPGNLPISLESFSFESLEHYEKMGPNDNSQNVKWVMDTSTTPDMWRTGLLMIILCSHNQLNVTDALGGEMYQIIDGNNIPPHFLQPNVVTDTLDNDSWDIAKSRIKILYEALNIEKITMGVKSAFKGKNNPLLNLKDIVVKSLGPYGLMFVSTLIAKDENDRNSFGVPTTKNAFGNALFHPYFSISGRYFKNEQKLDTTSGNISSHLEPLVVRTIVAADTYKMIETIALDVKTIVPTKDVEKQKQAAADNLAREQAETTAAKKLAKETAAKEAASALELEKIKDAEELVRKQAADKLVKEAAKKAAVALALEQAETAGAKKVVANLTQTKPQKCLVFVYNTLSEYIDNDQDITILKDNAQGLETMCKKELFNIFDEKYKTMTNNQQKQVRKLYFQDSPNDIYGTLMLYYEGSWDYTEPISTKGWTNEDDITARQFFISTFYYIFALFTDDFNEMFNYMILHKRYDNPEENVLVDTKEKVQLIFKDIQNIYKSAIKDDTEEEDEGEELQEITILPKKEATSAQIEVIKRLRKMTTQKSFKTGFGASKNPGREAAMRSLLGKAGKTVPKPMGDLPVAVYKAKKDILALYPDIKSKIPELYSTLTVFDLSEYDNESIQYHIIEPLMERLELQNNRVLQYVSDNISLGKYQFGSNDKQDEKYIQCVKMIADMVQHVDNQHVIPNELLLKFNNESKEINISF